MAEKKKSPAAKLMTTQVKVAKAIKKETSKFDAPKNTTQGKRTGFKK